MYLLDSQLYDNCSTVGCRLVLHAQTVIWRTKSLLTASCIDTPKNQNLRLLVTDDLFMTLFYKSCKSSISFVTIYAYINQLGNAAFAKKTISLRYRLLWFALFFFGRKCRESEMRLFRKIKYILAAGGAAGVLASFLAVHAFDEPLLEEKYKEDPALFVQQKPRSKWDANWDRSVCFWSIFFVSPWLWSNPFSFSLGENRTHCWSLRRAQQMEKLNHPNLQQLEI